MKFMLCVFLAVVAVVAAVDEPAPFQLTQTSDVDGTYSFSYTEEEASKSETRYPDGTVVGAYQYVDSDGILQKVQYQAGVEGVQLLATNLPVGSTEPVHHTEEVLQATEDHYHAIQRQLQLVARAAALEAEFRAKNAGKQ